MTLLYTSSEHFVMPSLKKSHVRCHYVFRKETFQNFFTSRFSVDQKGTATTENQLPNLLRHFMWDFIFMSVCTVKLFCLHSTSYSRTKTFYVIIHNLWFEKHFIFTIHEKHFTSFTPSIWNLCCVGKP